MILSVYTLKCQTFLKILGHFCRVSLSPYLTKSFLMRSSLENRLKNNIFETFNKLSKTSEILNDWEISRKKQKKSQISATNTSHSVVVYGKPTESWKENYFLENKSKSKWFDETIGFTYLDINWTNDRKIEIQMKYQLKD